MIVTGDFFQLPPVNKGSQQVKFAFEAELWKHTIKQTFNLTQVFRQKDPGKHSISRERPGVTSPILEFVDMLNEMRFGRLSSKSIRKFSSLSREIKYDDGMMATELYAAHYLLCLTRTNRNDTASLDGTT